MNKRQQKQAIDEMHTLIGYSMGLCDDALWDRLGDAIKAGEKAHRRMRP
jgi:hypothetical protein